MRVGVDIDGVLYDFAAGLRRYLLNTKYPNSVRHYPDPTRWEFYEDWGYTEKEFIDLCNEAVNVGELFWEGSPFPGAGRALSRLVDAGHEVILITDRFFGEEGASAAATRHWLMMRGFEYHELHFTSDKTSVPVDFMVDDKVANHIAMLDAGVKSFLLRRPWNTEFNNYVVDSLDEYVDLVLNEHVRRGPFVPTIQSSNEVTVTSATGGKKGKKLARFDLIPPAALRQVAELYGKGAEKYDDHNWRKGYNWSLSFAAMQRHAWQFWNGEEFDSETGCAHLASVAFHALALLTFMEEQRGFDDRFATTRSEGLEGPVKGVEPPCPCEPVSGPSVASEEGSTFTASPLCICYRCLQSRCG